ncbi:hypothetical protein DICSQDRAFT_183273 [Dichomitus squalens LYAD-421 SS1]|uniref:Uncharacterized protein n=1 Tax=Dichomitus squalens (strain LYAD-421) TaxID=732165 RepID=R7SMF2_DICSQ|nr:uncharacterized protein DICSQDRAFT_183273 [Dichomitus squalens LYAD-421 SS1]EJF57311.1 hypothetical protein DICSQDRAFT_183273 [Dichomitus squalens LYAD-421 SS1]
MSSQTPAAHLVQSVADTHSISCYGFTPGLYLPWRSTRSPSPAAPSTRKRDPRSQRPARLARFHHRRFRTSPGLRLRSPPPAPKLPPAAASYALPTITALPQRVPAAEAGRRRRAHAALGCQALGELA